MTTANPEPATEARTERIGACHLVRDVSTVPGVATLEGDLVPLLSGEALRSHLIVMHPGQYCFPHPHDSESIIYTISGRWVFCTAVDGEEDRITIEQGDLFHFPAGVPTGFETPFDEPAVILILKAGPASVEEMWQGMLGAKEHLEADASEGAAFRLTELPEDHPARVYARGAGAMIE